MLKRACGVVIEASFRFVRDSTQNRSFTSKAPTFFPPKTVRRGIPNVDKVVCVASGKGGVGKSSTAVNLAAALASQCNLRVGLLDADVHGPSIPQMMNLHGMKPELTPEPQNHLVPLENHGIKCMSMGFLAGAGQAVVWRGPMVGKCLDQMLFETVWGHLDILIVDLPPGTGDTHISLAQRLVVNGVVMVTTPQEVSLVDVRRSMQMFEKMRIPVLGIVENMSHYVCPNCQSTAHVFGSLGGVRLAEQEGLPLLGQIPLDVMAMQGSEAGAPIVLTHPNAPVSLEYAKLAADVYRRVSER